MAIGTTFRTGARSAADIASNARYLDELLASANKFGKTADEIAEMSADLASSTTFIKTISNNSTMAKSFANAAERVDAADLSALKKAVGDDAWAKIAAQNPNIAKKLDGTLDAGDDVIEAGSDAVKKADDLDIDNIDDLNKLDGLPPSQRKIANKAINDEYAELSPEALKLKGDEFLKADEKGMNAFKKLPANAQGKLVSANPKLRWKAGQQPAGFDWVKGACKNYPKMCAIGAAGGLVGAGYVTKEIYEEVEKVFDTKVAEKRACIATCLPNDFYESKVSRYGTKEYKDLDFRTVEDVKEESGDDNITTQNTPLCTATMDPPEQCQKMCVERCDNIHQSFTEKLVAGAGSLITKGTKEVGEAAGAGLKGILDGVFGEGMGIPAAIGIFIVIFIIIILTM